MHSKVIHYCMHLFSSKTSFTSSKVACEMSMLKCNAEVLQPYTHQFGYHFIHWLMMQGVQRKRVLAEAEHMIKDLQLEDKRNTPSSKLSGGMKRKLRYK